MISRVLEVRDLTATAFVLRTERAGLDFEAGQYVMLGRPGSLSSREYTVYSSPRDPWVEVLVKEIPGGLVSGGLRRAQPGDPLEMEGPFGKFRIPPEARNGRKLLFLATGTGVSPFHCFARSYPDLDYRLVHGARTVEELYERETFPPERYTSCVTRGPGGDYPGRLTGWLAAEILSPGTLCYLCGNSDMIYEAIALLREQGVGRDDMFAEIYF